MGTGLLSLKMAIRPVCACVDRSAHLLKFWASRLVCAKKKRRRVPFGGTRTHDLVIMRSKFCQLSHCRSLIYNGGRMIPAIITPNVQTTRPVCRPSQTGLVAQTGLGQQTGLSPRIWCTKQVFLQRSPCKICRPVCKKMQNMQTGL